MIRRLLALLSPLIPFACSSSQSEPPPPNEHPEASTNPPDAPDAEPDAPYTPTVTDTPPQQDAFPVDVDGQQAWVHDEGHPAGYFHTFDGLQAGGPDDAPRKVHVFLPRSYPAGSKRLPVIYMNDGDTAFFEGGAAGKAWDVATRLGTLYQQGAVPEIIVVAVHPLDREREYTHAEWAPGHACCGLPAYADYLADVLKPFVDQHYRTLASPSSTLVIGSSHGGLAAFYTASVRRDRFGHAIAMSPSFWAGLDGMNPGPLSSSSLLQATGAGLQDPAARPRLWLDWGLVRTGGHHNAVIEEMATRRGREMAGLLRDAYGYTDQHNLFVHEDPDGEHEEHTWGRRFEIALPAVTAGLAP